MEFVCKTNQGQQMLTIRQNGNSNRKQKQKTILLGDYLQNHSMATNAKYKTQRKIESQTKNCNVWSLFAKRIQDNKC